MLEPKYENPSYIPLIHFAIPVISDVLEWKHCIDIPRQGTECVKEGIVMDNFTFMHHTLPMLINQAPLLWYLLWLNCIPISYLTSEGAG